MRLLETLLDEVRRIGRWLGIDPARPLPEEVVIAEAPAEVHATSSLAEGALLISEDLAEHVNHILRKEAMSLFIPPESDEVPQVHDLAWAYSAAPSVIWDRVRVRPPPPFTNYDPIGLFSSLGTRGRERVIHDMILVLRAARTISLDLYLAALNMFFERELRLTEAERRIIRVLSTNPYASTKEIRERAGVSEASVSRSLRRLRRLGYIFGPENVLLGNLGLITLVVAFPNLREYREAFWRFPFTYTQLIPISRTGTVYAYLVFPRAGLRDLLELEDLGFEVGSVRRTAQRFNHEPPPKVIGEMCRAYLGGSPAMQVRIPEGAGIRLSGADVEILNQVLREGRASSGQLSRMGIRSAKQRLSRLREAGLIATYYMVGLPRGMETVLIRMDLPPEEVDRLVVTLAAASSSLVNHVEGRSSYCLAVSMVPREVRGDMIRCLGLIYGERVAQVQDVFGVLPQWQLPVRLWDERDQTFRWEEPLEELMKELRGAGSRRR